MAAKRAKRPRAPKPPPPPKPLVGEFDLLDPASQAIARPVAITDAAAFVLHYADRTAAGSPEGDRTAIEANRRFFVDRMATLKAADLSAEIRRAIDTAVRQAFDIGWFTGSLNEVRHELKYGPSERASHAARGRAGIIPKKAKKVSETVEDKGWSLDKRRKTTTIDKLAKEMKKSPRTIYRYLKKV